MNEVSPSFVDMEKLGTELGGHPPPEVKAFAPEKYRMSSSLAQTSNDMKKRLNNIIRKADEIKQEADELLRMIG